jgi:hypothetical protein
MKHTIGRLGLGAVFAPENHGRRIIVQLDFGEIILEIIRDRKEGRLRR